MSISTEIIQKIHTSGKKFVIAITGGGVEILGELLKRGGGSASIIECHVPYDPKSLEEFVQGRIEKSCSAQTARAMAVAAYHRCPRIIYADRIGIGATSSLVKPNGEREGREHWIHVAIQSAELSKTFSLRLTEKRTREQEENIASSLIFKAIAQTIGADVALPVKTEIISIEEATPPIKIQRIFAVESKITELPLNETLTDSSQGCILPGSFNPIHDNHLKMAEIGAQISGQPTHLEISLFNVDKPALDYLSINSRIQNIHPKNYLGNLFLTNAPTFYEKVQLLPGRTFLIGCDTLARLNNKKYYSRVSLAETISKFEEMGTKFLVFHRQGYDSASLQRDNVFKSICQFIDESKFKDIHGVSSTKIRKGEYASAT